MPHFTMDRSICDKFYVGNNEPIIVLKNLSEI